MNLNTTKIFLIFTITSSIMGTGCALFDEDKPAVVQKRVFLNDFNSVWRAAQIAIQKYPLQVNNMDKGLLQTSMIKDGSLWKAPGKVKNKAGLRYNLSLRILKGSNKGRIATKVIITKKLKLHKNFFSEAKALRSDYLEEKSILYRIGRELKIDKLLKKEQNKINSES